MSYGVPASGLPSYWNNYRTENLNGAGPADTWSAKTPEIEPDGSFFLYGNDIARGLDVYRFRGSAAPSTRTGTWLSPAKTAALPAARPKVPLTKDTAFFCLLPQ